MELAERTGSSSVEARGGARGAEAGAPPLPPGYALDVSDPDLLLLLRADGTMAAAFSAMGATAENVLEAAEQDARAAQHTAARAGRETASARNDRRPLPTTR